MLLFLSAHHSKKIAFSLLYLFFLPGFCSLVYGENYTPVLSGRNAVYGPSIMRGPIISPAVKNRLTAPVTDDKKPGKAMKGIPVKMSAVKNSRKLDIGGPSQPEMSAFKPVGADNMVDPFSGDFSYNIPLLDVGGYPVNIFYNSGISMDQEASWVGLGWNINPGTINRNMRGLPDDFNGSDIITKTQFMKPDKTFGVNVGGRVEIFGGALGIGIEGGIFYNNMRGLGLEAGINPAVSIGGKSGDAKTAPISFGWKLNANSQSGGSSTFNISIGDNNKKGLDGSLSASIGVHSRQGLQALHISGEVQNMSSADKSQYSIAKGDVQVNPTLGTSISFAYPSFAPSMRSRTSSENYDLDLGFGGAAWGIFGHLRLGGYYTRRWIKDDDVKISQPAYGMLYLQNGQQDKNALLDFNRLNDGVYTPGTPAIAVPVYTYDVYSITGEGTGGSFRAYRGDIGYMKDSYLENKGTSAHLGFELGAGGYGHGAINANVVLTPSSSGNWEKGNLAKDVMKFQNTNGAYQSVYFKNPGEKAIPDIAYQDAIGGEDLVRLKMTNTGVGSPTLLSSLVRYNDMLQRKTDLTFNTTQTLKKRDKRTQVISFLNAAEADRVGLNRQITYAPLNEGDSSQVLFGCSDKRWRTMKRNDGGPTALRKSHHVSEIDVLMQDGRRYVYDIPVYNVSQVDVTFNKKGTGGGNNANAPTVNYTPNVDNVAGSNNEGKDGFVERQEMPPYAHSYLLTALLSPNYVDVKGDGITEDDMGDAVKFNYSKSDVNLRWRTPAGSNTASLSEGLKTDKNDDKAHYVYGEREMWYLYSIESKNMVARFYVRNDRKDGRSIVNENGTLDPSFGSYRLAKISLFTKGELLSNPTNPKPVKTVNFEYDYSLCKNAPGSISGYGKLTLRRIFFTYNGNNKVKKNYYRFNYPTDAAKNPNYSFTANDRWGNYKADPSGGLSNSDFPYTDQDPVKTNEYVKAWTMNQVILPSGSAINVEYESDDYAFVQNRRASNMMTIAGLGTTPNPSASEYTNRLYDGVSSNFDYIYVSVPRAITATGSTQVITEQVKSWYFGDWDKNKQVYMKLAVQVPSDKMGSGYEMMPVYAQVESFGLIANDPTRKKIYIKVRRLASGYSPMVHYALQFLKSNLPSKAYPGYDVSEEGGLKAVVKALGGLFHSFKEVFNGGMKLMIQENKCKYIDPSSSFVRLTNPDLKKLGGGLRVKKVVINDNWDKMTRSNPNASDGMVNATYGQEYFYTKKELVNGELMTVSSGVASWEPALGAEENPHRQALEFYNKTPKADYDYRVMEMPFAEMLYPSASVGYSRVESRSIHRDTVKNAAGISVSEFYTTREFPTQSSYTPLSEYNAEDRYESGALDKLLKANLKTAVALSQGFKVDLNDMNGKPKKQATYSPNNLNDPITYSESFYSVIPTGGNTYKLNHQFPVIAGADGKVQQSTIGREIELMADFREHNLQTITTNINFNIDVISGVFIPIPIPTTWKPVVKESNIYRSAAMLKVVNHYSMLDSVVVVDKGSMVSTKNLVYDAETGEPLLTRTNNEHNRPVYNFTYPAHWAYSGMGLAYKNIDVTYSGVTFRNGKLESSNVDQSLLESGDELMVESQQNGYVLGVAPCDPLILPKSQAKKVWAINTGKSGSLTPQWVFLDANGIPYTADNVKMRIIRSGKRNMFGSPLGGIISLNNPLNASTGQLEFTDATNILQTSAATFKDHWRVDNSFFRFDSSYQRNLYARIKCQRYDVINSSMVEAEVDNNHVSGINSIVLNPTSVRGRMISYKRSYSWAFDSWLLFNVRSNPIPSNATIYSSRMSLYAHKPANWPSSAPQYYDHGYGAYSNNHPPGTPHIRKGSSNDVALLPMKTAWPSNNNGWSALFVDNNKILHDWNNIGYIPDAGYSDRNYLLQTTASDQRISIPNQVMYTMMAEARNPSSSVATGFRMMQRRDWPGTEKTMRKDDLSQCFQSNYQQGVPYYSNTAPKLNVYYYICGDTSYSNPCNYYALPLTVKGESQPPVSNVSLPDPDTLRGKMIICGVTDMLLSECRSLFTQRKSVNPYVEGIWGNWRLDTTYAYYGDRKENTVIDANPVDLRTAGTITGFKPFWSFAPSLTQYISRNFSASDVWVWNSTITQYNRRGYDIENKDPLDRFNAGLYGYNQQLPIAVVSNSRYMESLFDGFEDYDYQTNSCSESCKPRRHVDMGNMQPYLDGNQKHSGKKSLRLNAGQTFSFSAPVVPVSSLDKPYRMRVKVDSSSYTVTTVNPMGTGFRGQYYNYSASSILGCGYAASQANNALNGSPAAVRQNEQINFSTNFGLPPGIGGDKFAVRWEGYIQPLVTGSYSFMVSADDGYKLYIDINGSTQQLAYRWDCNWGANTTTNPVTLNAGQLYKVRMEFFERTGNHFAQLVWKTPNDPNNWLAIPKAQVYMPDRTGDAAGTVITTTKWCTKVDSVNVRGNALTDSFTLVQGRKMLVSAWVRVGGNDCKCSTYTNNKIRVSYVGGSAVSEFVPAGSIIEGWQRYEGVFDIPATATKVKVDLMNTGGSAQAWFDDLRIHPFNANMKSFVYHPQNLRLMSELDENNYASFYEYDDDGTLARVKKETVKGVKTVSETRSHMQTAVDQ
jgi:hypothetical protein